MRSNKYTLNKTKSDGHSNKLLPIYLLFYFVFIIVSGFIISHRTQTEIGQFIPGENYTGESFSRSLDLRVIAKNVYPSSPLLVVKKLGTADGVTQVIVSFKVPVDGLIEYGLMFLPSTNKPTNGYPSVVLCHGYTNPSSYITTANYIDDMLFYAQKGFVVIKPDYRGQGVSLNNGQADSGYYSMSYNTDVMSLISALKQTKYIDKSNINLIYLSL